jgi:hypothetical protein
VEVAFEAGKGGELPIPTNRDKQSFFVFCVVVKRAFSL